MKFTIKDNNSAVGIIELFKVIKNLNNYSHVVKKMNYGFKQWTVVMFVYLI